VLAQFPPITLPGDLISYASARTLLYPDLESKNTGLQRVWRDVQAARLRAYRIGLGHEMRQFVSRAGAPVGHRAQRAGFRVGRLTGAAGTRGRAATVG
jgi:hypothetical protein